MRFYLDVPLVVGYVLMATISCLGMLQLMAARGEYSGLSLFTGNYRTGKLIGAVLTIGAVTTYVLFAPEILTPGPAGTEVAEMFAACALVALAITLVGAGFRNRRSLDLPPKCGKRIDIEGLLATFFHAGTGLPRENASATNGKPTVVLLEDPSGFVATPQEMTHVLCSLGMSVLLLEYQASQKNGGAPRASGIRESVTAAIDWLEKETLTENDSGPVGLIGCGLGADAVLWTAEVDPRVVAALGVAPTATAPRPRGASAVGVDWLRELSYRQAWLWRRRWPAIQQTAADFASSQPRTRATNASRAVFVGGEPQTAVTGVWSDAEILSTSKERHFSVLENVDARSAAADWLFRKLSLPKH